ncbi:MAG: hypothetical protein ACEPOZ_18735 [Marinifilaceae bacterium]
MRTLYYLIPVFLLTFFTTSKNTLAQEQTSSFNFDNSFTSLSLMDSTSYLTGALGITRIGGQNYAGMRFQPELNLGKIGFGLDIPLYFNLDNGNFYSDEFKKDAGVLRLISYFRYGRKKQDPVFFKIGELKGERIGYGSLVNNYSNSVSFENRKVGFTYDIIVKKTFGVEGLYSDFNLESFNLFAIRPYVRPFGQSDIPVIKTLDFGFTFVKDKDHTARYSGTEEKNEFLSDGMSAWGWDMGITLINSSFINLAAYMQYSKLNKVKSDSLAAFYATTPPTQGHDSGDGFGMGLNANMNVIGNVFRLNARIERLWYSSNYLPQFFDAIYEVNKDAKILALGDAQKKQGIYGSVTASFIDKILIGGNLMLPDNVSETTPALLQLNLRTQDLFDKIIIEGSYTKGNLTRVSDALKFDSSSLALMRFAYKINPFLVTGVDYRWTWIQGSDGNFRADNMVTPYVAFRLPLN